MKSLREMMDIVEGKAGSNSKIDQQIIDLLTAGMPPEDIAAKLNIPVEWVDEEGQYNMPDYGPDFADPKNMPPANRFGEGLDEEATPEAVQKINKLFQDKR